MKIIKSNFLGILILLILVSTSNLLSMNNKNKNKSHSKNRIRNKSHLLMKTKHRESEENFSSYKPIKYYNKEEKQDEEKRIEYKRPLFTNDKSEMNYVHNKLNERIIEDIDEIETNRLLRSKDDDYYDGSRKLKYYSQFCSGFNKSLTLCKQQESCGWCFSSNTCIHGGKEGPVDDCRKRHFMYKGNLI